MGRKSNWSLEQQLLDGRAIDPNTGCWLWRNYPTSGWRQLDFQGKRIGVHRAAAHVWLGFALDNSLFVLHKRECKSRNCINPEHLYIGTQKENIQDSVYLKTHKEARKIYCSRGHEFTAGNTRRYTYKGKVKRRCKQCVAINNSLRIFNKGEYIGHT